MRKSGAGLLSIVGHGRGIKQRIDCLRLARTDVTLDSDFQLGQAIEIASAAPVLLGMVSRSERYK